MSGLPAGWNGGVYAQDGPETRDMRFGIIALTDCAPIVMAHELGYFKKFGINSVVSKEASWAVIRDKLTLGENQATHMLYGMPYASTLGLLGSPKKPTIIPFCLNHNGQAITLTKALLDKGVRTASELKPAEVVSLSPGDRVNHQRWGVGRVMAVEGQGAGAQAQIDFGDQVMWIRLRNAQIEKL